MRHHKPHAEAYIFTGVLRIIILVKQNPQAVLFVDHLHCDILNHLCMFTKEEQLVKAKHMHGGVRAGIHALCENEYRKDSRHLQVIDRPTAWTRGEKQANWMRVHARRVPDVSVNRRFGDRC